MNKKLVPEDYGFTRIGMNSNYTNDDGYELYNGMYSTGEYCWTLYDTLYSKIYARCSEQEMILKLTALLRKKKIFLISRELEQ